MKQEDANLPFWHNISNFAIIVGGITHDLNGVLAAIYGYTELSFHVFNKNASDEDKKFIALKKLKVVRIYAGIFEYNKASQRILEKCGFEKEAYLKDEVYLDGQYNDIVLLGKIMRQ